MKFFSGMFLTSRKNIAIAAFAMLAVIVPAQAQTLPCSTKKPGTTIETLPDGTKVQTKVTWGRTQNEIKRYYSDIKIYCTSGSMGNKKDCSIAKKNFLDAVAWAYNSKGKIPCQFTDIIGTVTAEKIQSNSLLFLKESRFTCGGQLCCQDCLHYGSKPMQAAE